MRLTVFMPVDGGQSMEFHVKDVGFIPIARHYIEDTRDDNRVLLRSSPRRSSCGSDVAASAAEKIDECVSNGRHRLSAFGLYRGYAYRNSRAGLTVSVWHLKCFVYN